MSIGIDNIIVFFPIIIFPTVIIIFISIYIKTQKPVDVELVRDALYKETCGGWIGSSNSTFPFVRIAFYDEFVVIVNLRNRIILNYDQITDVSMFYKTMKKGVKISHSRTDIPERIVVWTLNDESLIERINIFIRNNRAEKT